MTTRYYMDLEQKSPEWYEARRGIVTASNVGKLITPMLKVADNDTSRSLTRTLVAERITGHVEETVTTNAMWRGILDEPLARDLYAETYAPVTECGFVTRDFGKFTLGFSPDGLVGTDGLIEIKSREPHLHLAIILEPKIPHAHMAQMQAGLMVTGREWCDYISYAGGLPMWKARVFPIEAWQGAITAALLDFETNAAQMVADYTNAVEGLPATERVDHFPEIEVGR